MKTLSDPDTRRFRMVEGLRRKGVKNEDVLLAMGIVPRHRFCLSRFEKQAYEDRALPYLCGKTVSQPFVVATMLGTAVQSRKGKVLEVGTGSGYQTALLCELFENVFSLDIHPELTATAERNLRSTGYSNYELKTADGYSGWLDRAPFDSIVVACAPRSFPAELEAQLSEKAGVMSIPVGTPSSQSLYSVFKQGETIKRRRLYPVFFIEMTSPETAPLP